MIKQVKDVISQFTDVTMNEVDENTVLTADLGLSSFDVVAIVAAFEDEFDIEIPDRDIKKLITVGDIASYLSEKI